jgi:multidrug resistance efflux pump
VKKIVAIAAAAVVALSAYLWQRHRQASRPFEWSGTVEAHTMEVGSRIGGRIARVLVREGDRVTYNQVLIELEPGDLPGQREQALGQVAQAEAALAKVTTLRTSTARRAEIAGAIARVRGDRIEMERASRDKKRIDELLEKGAITPEESEHTASTYRAAEARVAQAQASLAQLLEGTPEDVKSATGVLEAARGRLQQIDANIAELKIFSPLPARVEALDLRPGDLLAPGVAAAKLLAAREMYVRIYVPETQLAFVQPGMSVPVSVDSFKDRTFRGVVEFISDVGEFTPRNLQTADERANQVFATRVRLEEGEDILRVGMAALVRVKR